MVLRCSLLGHDYGDLEVERDRDERGSDVVVTVLEFERCARCGVKNVISENTEVKRRHLDGTDEHVIDTDVDTGEIISDDEAETMNHETDVDSESVPSAADETRSPSDSTRSSEYRPADDGAGARDGAERNRESIDSPTAASSRHPVDGQPAAHETDSSEPPDGQRDQPKRNSGVDVPTDDYGEPITDDGEILEDESDDEPDVSGPNDRARGQWPDSDDVGPPVGTENRPADWPAQEQPDSDDDSDTEVIDHGTQNSDEVITDVEPETDGRTPVDGGTSEGSQANPHTNTQNQPHDRGDERHTATSDQPVKSDTIVTDSHETLSDSDEPRESRSQQQFVSGIASVASAPSPTERAPMDGDVSEFFCPQCDFVAPDHRGSLRSGDICPECRKGYLGERHPE